MIPSPSDFALQEQDILQALNKAKPRDVDYADMYLESSVTDSVSMEESLVKRAVKSVAQGAGIRAVAGERTGFAYSDDLSVRDLVQAAETARYIAESPQGAIRLTSKLGDMTLVLLKSWHPLIRNKRSFW
jgi:TldD protein